MQKAEKQYKKKETNINNTNRTVSLEEMISQTTELKNSNFENIDRNISSSSSQSDEQPIQTRTLTKNDFSSSNEIINSNQDTANPDKKKKDLMLLNRLSLGTAVNDESQRKITTTEKHTLQRNSSLRPSSRRKT